MKKLIAVLFLLGAALLFAAPLSPFNCNQDLSEVCIPNESGEAVSAGSYDNALLNYPTIKSSMDEAIILRVQATMTNQILFARPLANAATNHGITIPAETWDYLNSH